MTNKGFLLDVLGHPDFVQGGVHTSLARRDGPRSRQSRSACRGAARGRDPGVSGRARGAARALLRRSRRAAARCNIPAVRRRASRSRLRGTFLTDFTFSRWAAGRTASTTMARRVRSRCSSRARTARLLVTRERRAQVLVSELARRDSRRARRPSAPRRVRRRRSGSRARARACSSSVSVQGGRSRRAPATGSACSKP